MTILLNKPVGYVSGQPEDNHEPAMVRPAPTLAVCVCTPSNAAPYWRMKSSDQGMPVR